MVDMLLVVIEEIVLLLGEMVGFERYFEAVCRLRWSLEVSILALMDCMDEVEFIA